MPCYPFSFGHCVVCSLILRLLISPLVTFSYLILELFLHRSIYLVFIVFSSLDDLSLCISNIDYVLKSSKPPLLDVTCVNLTVTWLIQIILLVLC